MDESDYYPVRLTSAGTVLRVARRFAQFSQRELAERSRVSYSTISRVEGSAGDTSWRTVQACLRACGLRTALVSAESGTLIEPKLILGRDAAGRHIPAHLSAWRVKHPMDHWLYTRLTTAPIFDDPPPYSYRLRDQVRSAVESGTMNEQNLPSWPGVTVVMPIRDEEPYLVDAVDGVLGQAYPGELEIILAVAPSKDRTDEVAQHLAATDERIRVVLNPAGRTPAGLNAALAKASHGIIVRVDGHGVLSAGYVQNAVVGLQTTGAANVGGVMRAEGRTDFECAVARAYTSPVGLGGGRFHTGGTPGPADTVYLGVFRREVLEKLGGYDEHFVRAQDWELNHRIRDAGEAVWFDPSLWVSYRPRPNIRALAKQFFRTGQWRREVIRRYPDTANWRYLAAPLVTVAVALGLVCALVALLGGPAWLAVGWLAPVGYALGVLGASLAVGRDLPRKARAWLPAVLTTVHLTWGAGFIIGVRKSA